MYKLDKKNVEILKKLLNDNEKVVINNESVEMKKIRELETNFKPGESKLKFVILFWDDLIQYTTLGLIDVILDMFDDIEDKTYDFDLFFYRGFEDSYFLDFVKRLFKEKFNKILSDEFILNTFKTYYSEILKRSPASSFFSTFIKCGSLYKNVVICFRYNFDGIDKFTASIYERFVNKSHIKLQSISLEKYKDECDFLIKHGKECDIVMIQNLGKAIEFIDTTKKNGLSMVSPHCHNGVCKEYFEATYFIHGNTRVGPYNSEITIFNEGISVA